MVQTRGMDNNTQTLPERYMYVVTTTDDQGVVKFYDAEGEGAFWYSFSYCSIFHSWNDAKHNRDDARAHAQGRPVKIKEMRGTFFDI